MEFLTKGICMLMECLGDMAQVAALMGRWNLKAGERVDMAGHADRKWFLTYDSGDLLTGRTVSTERNTSL